MRQEQMSHDTRDARGQEKCHQNGYSGLQPPVDDDEEHEQPHHDPPNRLIGRELLVEVKTLARTDITPNARAVQFQSDVSKRVRDLDFEYPGSTFEDVFKSYGEKGKYLVLVDGPFSNLIEMPRYLLISLLVYALAE